MLNYLYKRYKLPIYMTENVSCSPDGVRWQTDIQGIAPKGEWDLPVEEAVRKSLVRGFWSYF